MSGAVRGPSGEVVMRSVKTSSTIPEQQAKMPTPIDVAPTLTLPPASSSGTAAQIAENTRLARAYGQIKAPETEGVAWSWKRDERVGGLVTNAKAAATAFQTIRDQNSNWDQALNELKSSRPVPPAITKLDDLQKLHLQQQGDLIESHKKAFEEQINLQKPERDHLTNQFHQARENILKSYEGREHTVAFKKAMRLNERNYGDAMSNLDRSLKNYGEDQGFEFAELQERQQEEFKSHLDQWNEFGAKMSAWDKSAVETGNAIVMTYSEELAAAKDYNGATKNLRGTLGQMMRGRKTPEKEAFIAEAKPLAENGIDIKHHETEINRMIAKRIARLEAIRSGQE